MAKEKKHRYSRKVRTVGYCVIILEILTVVVWLVAWYGNGLVVISLERSITGGGEGGGLGFVQTPDGASITIPVTGGGLFTVTTRAELVLANNRTDQVLADEESAVTVSPGETQNITLTVPMSAMPTNGSSPTDYDLKINFQIGTLSNLVGAGFGTSINLGAFSGGVTN